MLFITASHGFMVYVDERRWH